MSCNHSNPPHFVFCGSCGESLELSRCRCGFANAGQQTFCGCCGQSLHTEHSTSSDTYPVEGKYDLADLVRQTAAEQDSMPGDEANVTQDDIASIIASMKEKLM